MRPGPVLPRSNRASDLCHFPIGSFLKLLCFDRMSLIPYRRVSGLALGARAARYAYDNRASIRSGLLRARNYAASRMSNGRSLRVNRSRGMSRGYTGQGVTSQHDVSQIYKKKYMRKGKKRRWRKFVRRVHAVAEKDMGSRTVVFNTQVTLQTTQGNDQLCGTFALYSQSSNQAHLNDLANISGGENLGDPSAASGITLDKTTRIYFQSGVLDLTVRNTSFQNDATSVGAKMEVDVYEMYMSKPAMISNTGYGSLSDIFQQAAADTKVLNNTGVACAVTRRGVTPFDITYALSRFGIKIVNKRKYFLESGGTFTYQSRDPRRHVVDIDDIKDQSGFNRPKLTRIVYMIARVVPGYTVGVGGGTFTEQLSVGVTRKYLYKFEGANEDRDFYGSSTSAPTNPF